MKYLREVFITMGDIVEGVVGWLEDNHLAAPFLWLLLISGVAFAFWWELGTR